MYSVQMAGEAKIRQYHEIITDFVKDCKDLILQLRQFKKQIKIIVPIKEQELQYYKHFVDFLIKYEEVNTKRANMNGVPVISLLTGDDKIDMKDKLQKLVILSIKFLIY